SSWRRCSRELAGPQDARARCAKSRAGASTVSCVAPGPPGATNRSWHSWNMATDSASIDALVTVGPGPHRASDAAIRLEDAGEDRVGRAAAPYARHETAP